MRKTLPPEGPKPIVTFLILIGCIIIFGMIFAAIRVFLLDSHDASGIIQEQGSIDVTFCPTQHCEERLLDELNRSNTSSCAFYELNLERVIQQLAAEHTDVLVFSENAGKVANLTIQPVPSQGLMHDKFCVLDIGTDPHITTGSMNPTRNDARLNDNNLLVIHSASIAQRYQHEFDELESRSGDHYTKNQARPLTVNLSGVLIEQRFCPQEQCEHAVVQQIAAAQHEVEFMIFTFTSDAIGDAMVAAHQRGLFVQGVMEKRQLNKDAERDKLLANGVDVRIDGNKNTMHHKVIIIDNATVITGSYNPTASAEKRNDENLLIIHDPALAAKYRAEYERVYALGSES